MRFGLRSTRVVTEGRLVAATVVVDGERIAAVETETPVDLEVEDLGDKVDETHNQYVENDTVASVIFYILIVGLIYFVTHTFSGRAAFIQVGAMFGFIMVSNVWSRILPGQTKMIEARKAGKEPDMSFGVRGKQRSKHNTFMSVPLIFIMVSNHFPVATYGHQYNWVILSVLVLIGWVGAKLIRDH